MAMKSKDMVNALLENGLRIFNESKLTNLSGLIPNKEELVKILIEREADRHLAILEEKYKAIKGSSFEEVIETLIREIAHAMNQGKIGIRILLTSTFAVERLEALLHARRSLVLFVEQVIRDHGFEKDSALKSQLIVSSLGGIVETMVFKRNESVSDEDMIKESTKMILSYCSL